MSDEVHATITEPKPGIIQVTFDRPAKLNAISPQMTETLWEATRQLAERDDLRVMVITANGRFFTAGIDLGGPRSWEDSDEHPGWAYRRGYRRHHLLYDEMETIEKPIILAAQATILGAGVEMAMSCDFRFCTPQAEWGVPEIQIGVIAGSGGSSRLTRQIGPHWAKWMAMAGMRVGGDQAKTIGLVHDVYPPGTFLEEVYKFCDRMISLPQEAVGLAKLAVDLAADTDDRGVQRHVDRLVNTTLINSEAFKNLTSRFRKG